MKCLHFLVFMGVALGLAEGNLEMAAPVMAGVVIKDDSLNVKWNQVVKSSEPVLGYIVKVWALQDIVAYKISAGYKVSAADTLKALMDPYITPSETPKDIKVEGADVTNAVIKDIKTNMQYHIRVQAYSKNHLGPLSGATGIRLE